MKINLLLEEDVYRGKAKNRVAAHGLHSGDAHQRDGQGVGDLILNVLRRTSRPLRKDNLLVFPDIWNGIHWNGVAWKPGCLPGKGSDADTP